MRFDDTEVADTETDFAEAGVGDALAVVCAGDDDSMNLEIDLLARKANPDVRVVARLANDVLREAVAPSPDPKALAPAAPASVSGCRRRAAGRRISPRAPRLTQRRESGVLPGGGRSARADDWLHGGAGLEPPEPPDGVDRSAVLHR